MNNIKWMVAFAALVTAGVGVYLWKMQEPKAPPPPPPPVAKVEEPTPVPENHYAVGEDPSQANGAKKPLPNINESDPSFGEEVQALLGKDYLSLFVNQDLIRKIVVTVTNADQKELPEEQSPFVETGGKLVTAKKDGSVVLDVKNANRYHKSMKMIEHLDVSKLVSVYKRFYPLFQAAYEELGTKGYFNDILVKRLDLLLSTPDVKDEPKLIHANVSYHYENPEIEDLTAAQKTLIRLGSANETIVKKKLQEFRASVVHLN